MDSLGSLVQSCIFYFYCIFLFLLFFYHVICRKMVWLEPRLVLLSCILKVTGCDWFQGVTKDKADGDYKEWTVRDEDGDKDAVPSVFLKK